MKKFNNLVVLDKRKISVEEGDSCLLIGTNLLGCCISKALRLASAARRRFESAEPEVNSDERTAKVMIQRWLRHDEDDERSQKKLVADFPYMLRRSNACAILARQIRALGRYPSAHVAEECSSPVGEAGGLKPNAGNIVPAQQTTSEGDESDAEADDTETDAVTRGKPIKNPK